MASSVWSLCIDVGHGHDDTKTRLLPQPATPPQRTAPLTPPPAQQSASKVPSPPKMAAQFRRRTTRHLRLGIALPFPARSFERWRQGCVYRMPVRNRSRNSGACPALRTTPACAQQMAIGSVKYTLLRHRGAPVMPRTWIVLGAVPSPIPRKTLDALNFRGEFAHWNVSRI